MDSVPDEVYESIFKEVDRLSQDILHKKLVALKAKEHAIAFKEQVAKQLAGICNEPVAISTSKELAIECKLPIIELPQVTSESSVSFEGEQNALQVSLASTAPVALNSSEGPGLSDHHRDHIDRYESHGRAFGGMKTLNLNILNVQDFQEVWKVLHSRC